MEWNKIEDAPKDGTTVWLCWFDGKDGPFDVCKMYYDQNITNKLFPGVSGFWTVKGGSVTWLDDKDFGGPTHFAWVQ